MILPNEHSLNESLGTCSILGRPSATPKKGLNSSSPSPLLLGIRKLPGPFKEVTHDGGQSQSHHRGIICPAKSSSITQDICAMSQRSQQVVRYWLNVIIPTLCRRSRLQICIPDPICTSQSTRRPDFPHVPSSAQTIYSSPQ